MISIAFNLLTAAIIIIICIVLNKVTSRFGVPMLLAFIALGMFFGTDGIVKIHFDNYIIAEKICSIALIFIMFYGGFGTSWQEARPVAVKAVLLASVGVVLTAAFTGLFCYYVLKIEFWESMLIGSVLSSTDAASVFSILRSKKLNLKYGTASLLEMESGSNDPSSYMLTIIVLSIMSGSNSGGKIIQMVFAQLFLGIIIGLAIAFIALFVLKRFSFATAGFDAAFVLAIAILSFAIPTILGGNGYLSAYIVGIIIGNSKIKNKSSLVHFFDGITGLMQMVIFFLLGLLAFPSQLPSVMIPSIAIAFFITLVARPLAVFLLLSPSRCRINQQLVVAWCGLRGAASIVFAILVTVSSAGTNNDVFHIVFFIVLLSIAFQGTLLPIFARKLNMIDKDSDVLKTFNDYVEEDQVQFISLSLNEYHPWIGKKIKNITLPPETLIVLLVRKSHSVVPRGNTILDKGDVVILSAPAYHQHYDIELSEERIHPECKWKDKRISEIKLEEGSLIVLVKRSGKMIIPNGNTKLKENDVLVINSEK